MTVNPHLAKALSDSDASTLVAIALRARAAADQGRYCECAEPELVGDDLLCGACLLNNRDQEVKAVLRLVSAHEFVPSTRFKSAEFNAHFCAVCTQSVDHPRHHGVHSVGRTSWGDEVRP